MKMYDFNIERFNIQSICVCCANVFESKESLSFNETLRLIDTRIGDFCISCSNKGISRFAPFHVCLSYDTSIIVHWNVFHNLQRFQLQRVLGCNCRRYDVACIEPPISICINCGKLPRAYKESSKHFVSAFKGLQRLASISKKD